MIMLVMLIEVMMVGMMTDHDYANNDSSSNNNRDDDIRMALMLTIIITVDVISSSTCPLVQ